MSGLRILVTGSREWREWGVVEAALRAAWTEHGKEHLPSDTTVVHGDAPGADACADVLAPHLGFKVEPHAAKWKTYGKKAGPIRNQHMVDLGADVCVTFAAQSSVGTFDCADRARAAGIPVMDFGVSTRIEDRS